MSELELSVDGYQVEVVGDPAPIGKKLIVDRHDISSMTREISIRVPADGMPTVDVTLLPHRFLAKLDIPVEGMRLWIEGIGALLSRASMAEKKLRDNGWGTEADQIKAAIDRVESGLDG